MWKPMHMQPLFKNYEFYSDLENASVSEDLFNRGVCLPSDTKMTKKDLDRVINTIKGSFVNSLEEVASTC